MAPPLESELDIPVIFFSVLKMRNWSNIFFFLLFLGGCSSTSTTLQIQPQSKVSEDPNPEALKYFMEGQLYMNQGNYAMAKAELQKALLIDKNVSTIHLSLADCYLMLKKPDSSTFHMKKAISVEPENQNIKELLAKRFLSLKQLNGAEQVYLQLYVENPDSVKYILSLAELARLQNNLEDAIFYYPSS